MKKLRKILISVLVIALALTFTISLIGCKNEGENEGVKKVSLIVVGEVVAGVGTSLKTYELETEVQYLEELFKELVNSEDVDFSYTATYSAMGEFIASYTHEDETFPSVDGAYIILYSSLDDINYSAIEFTVTVDGEKYYGLGKGVSNMPVINGAKYIICSQSFS